MNSKLILICILFLTAVTAEAEKEYNNPEDYDLPQNDDQINKEVIYKDI